MKARLCALVLSLAACAPSASPVESLFMERESFAASPIFELQRTLAYRALDAEGLKAALPLFAKLYREIPTPNDENYLMGPELARLELAGGHADRAAEILAEARAAQRKTGGVDPLFERKMAALEVLIRDAG